MSRKKPRSTHDPKAAGAPTHGKAAARTLATPAAPPAPTSTTAKARKNAFGVAPADWGCVGLLVLLTCAFFWKGIIDPAGMTREDAAYQYQPWYTFVADEMKAGRMPHWSPYAGMGIPFHSTLAGAALDPFRWHQIGMDYADGYVLSVIFHFGLAAIFTYVFLRVTLRCGPLASLVGAISFGFGGYTFGHVTHPNFYLAFPWFVLAVFFFSRAVERSSWSWAVATAIPVALIGLGGSPHLLLILAYGLGLWGAGETILRAIRRRTWHGRPGHESQGRPAPAHELDSRKLHGRDARATHGQAQRAPDGDAHATLAAGPGKIGPVVLPLAAVFVACALGGLIAAAQLWPAQLQSKLSTRSGATYEEITEICAGPARSLLRMAVPYYYGNYRLGYWGEDNFHEHSFYPGLAVLVAAVAAVALCWKNRWVPRIVLFAVVVYVTAAGRYLPFYWVLYKLLPGFDSLRNPVRFMIWVQLGIAALAAIGIQGALDAGRESLRGRVRAVAAVAAAAFVLVIGAALLRLHEYAGDALARQQAVASALELHKELDPRVREALKSGRLDALQHMTAKVFAQGDGATWTQVVVGLLSAAAAAGLFALKKRPVRAMAWGLAALTVVDLGALSLGMLHYSENLWVIDEAPPHVQFLQKNLGLQRYVSALGQEDATTFQRGFQYRIRNLRTPKVGVFYTPREDQFVGVAPRFRRLLDLAGVKYIVQAGKPPSGEGLVSVYDSNGVSIVENRQAMPLAFLARRLRVLADGNEVLRELAVGKDDLRETAFVEKAVPPLAGAGGTGAGDADSAGDVTVEAPRPGEYLMRTRAPADRQLVLMEAYHPQWKCAVDGNEVPIDVTDYVGMSVRVPAGTHEVHWWFDPARYRQGLVGMAAGTLFVLGFLVFAAVRSRLRRKTVTSSP